MTALAIRFSQKDILRGSTDDVLSLNRYTYVKNDPINLVDPSGMFFNSIKKATNIATSHVSSPIYAATSLTAEKINPKKTTIASVVKKTTGNVQVKAGRKPTISSGIEATNNAMANQLIKELGLVVDILAFLTSSDYTAESGSLKLTIKAAYLDGLSEGDHSLQVNFKDGGTAYADFTIVGAGGGNGGNSQPNNQGGGDAAQTEATTGTTEAKTGSNPKTGDSNAMALLFGIVALSGAGAFVVIKKKQTVK